MTQAIETISAEQDTAKRVEALAKYLKCEIDDISETRHCGNTFDAESGEYIVLTDDEADERAKECIKDTLWAFNAEFIVSHAKAGLNNDSFIKSLRTMQDDQCESCNEVIEALIEDMDHFINDAISADGRGHFMSSYDGEENESTINGETFYIYRTN